MRIKKDDTVIVLTGKDKGKTGKVLKAMPKEGRVIVEGVNVQTKHQKQTQKEAAEIKHQEGPVNVSNVMYYDTKNKTASRIGYKVEDGKKVRIAKKTGAVID
ncbi:MAG: 50S ribosomal protein L24 [Anaerovoracaceae bacterium]|nr:50S ribosomal protein L24 [Anaerovoracaceae bacterium]